MLPAVSIVIPVYNGAKTLAACLNSIKNISYPRELLEVIVVNNGSTDESASIAKNYPSIVLIHENNKGRSHARNTGRMHASHSLIAFIDCDVILEKQWLRFMIKLFRSPKVGAAQGKIDLIPLKGKSSLIDRFRFFHKGISTKNTMIETTHFSPFFPIINTASCIYRKEVLEQLGGFDPRFSRGEDADLSFRTSREGYLVGFNELALSYALWDKGGYFSYLLREIENARFSTLLKRKFYQKKDSISSNLIQTLKWNTHLFIHESHSWMVFLEILQKTIFGIAYTYYDFTNKLPNNFQLGECKAISEITLGDSEKHLELKKHLGHSLSLHDHTCIKSVRTLPNVRISLSPNQILLYDSKKKRGLLFTNEEFYFLRSFILDDDYYFHLVSIDRFREVMIKTMGKLLEHSFVEISLHLEELCFNPFLSFKRFINEDDVTESFHAMGARAFYSMDGNFVNNSSPNEKAVFNFIENHLSQPRWDLNSSPEIENQTLNSLCREDFVISKKSLRPLLEKAFSLRCFISEDMRFNNRLIKNIPKDLEVHPILLNQMTEKVANATVFNSHLKQMNNLMTVSDDIFWTFPWSFEYPMPLFIDHEMKQSLISFKASDWSEDQLNGMLDAGVLTSSSLPGIQINTDDLKNSFLATQAFHVSNSVAAYVTWSMGKFLYLYFNSGRFKIGDFQCADRKAIYDNPLCLHIQEGFSKIINRILPFQVKSSFNYSVNYLEHAELYRHKDRPEAPLSMSYTLASYKGTERCHYQNALGHVNDAGIETEIELADGDIALFNGANLTHYRKPIAEGHSIYVIVMHFVDSNYKGYIG